MGAGCVQLSERSKDGGWMNGSSSILYTIAQPGFSPVIYNAHGHARGAPRHVRAQTQAPLDVVLVRAAQLLDAPVCAAVSGEEDARGELGAEVEGDGDEVVRVDLPDGVQDADHVRVRVRRRVSAIAGENAIFSALPLVEGGREQPAEVLVGYSRGEDTVA